MKIRRVVHGGEAKNKTLCTLDFLDKVCFPLDALEKKFGWWWIGYEDEEPMCFVGARFEHQFYRIVRIGVLKKDRGKGYAKRLLRTVKRHANCEGYHEVRTYTSVINIGSMNSLISCGYRPIRINYFGKDKFIVWSVKWET